MTWGRYRVCFKFDRPIVVIDFETTGLSWSKHSIIEMAAVRMHPGSMQGEGFQTLIKQEKRIPKRIVELTGITDDMVAGGLDPCHAVEKLLSFIGSAPVVAYNATFDLGFLNAACEKHITAKIARSGHSCALKLAQRTWRHLPNHRLNTVAIHLGLNMADEHRALGDAMRTAAVYRLGMILND